ncbi:hypothetical protein C0995_015929 [Termitomyces sp. Mi166|nr:hypothetical protein C0995_015929 [Termitomyces sp. Mi166\
METYSFPQFGGSRAVVHAALYTNVTNAAEIRKRIIEAATAEGDAGKAARDAVNFGYIDARLTAIYQAMLAESQNALRTRTVHSEVIWALNPTNNITEALGRYGISDKTTAVIVVSMDGAPEAKMGAGIAGTLTELDGLGKLTDWAAVRKYHKLNSTAKVDAIVVSTVAMKTPAAAMLPKVATHITRAVTSIQHQSYTIRNVLHAQSSSTSASNTTLAPWNSPGSSHRGHNNGPGSAKYGAGSRYTGYTGAGRAVTQANATISSNDGSFVQSDDQDEVSPRRPAVSSASSRRTRIRSNSLSIPSHGRTERGENLGVLKTVQLHARSRHAFAPQPTPSPEQSVPRPRRNSTSAPAPTESFDPTIPAPSPQPSRRASVSSASRSSLSLDPASPQSVQPPKPDRTEVTQAAKRLLEARNSGNSVRAAEAVREFRQNVVNPSVREFNAALEALQATRRPGEPLNLMLDTYNDMLRHSLLPNVGTYVALIDTLTARDQEVHSAITALELRIKHRALTGFKVASDQADRNRIQMLRRENNFNTAMSLFETVLSIGGNNRLSSHTYASLLRSCAINSNIDAAIHVFAQQEKRDDLLPSIPMFVDMIRVYTNAGQLPGAEDIFAEYRAALKLGNIHVNWAHPGADPNRQSLLVWNQMIETYFRFDRADKAIALVEQMLAAELTKGLIADPPPVSSATFTTVLTGFCQMGDVQTALVWFDRLLAQQASSQDPFEPTGVAMKPDSVAWGAMLDALAVKGMVDDINRLFTIRLQDDPQHIRNTERTIVYAANMARLETLDDEQYRRTLAWLSKPVLNTSEFRMQQRLTLTAEISAAYLDRKMYEQAFVTLSVYLADFMRATTTTNHGLGFPPSFNEIHNLQLKFTEKLYQVSQGDVPYSIPMELARIAGKFRISQSPSLVPLFLQSYALSRASGTLPIVDMTLRDWELILMAANTFESSTANTENPQDPVSDFAFQGLASLIRDFAEYKVALGKMSANLVRHVCAQLNHRLGTDGLLALLNETGFSSVLKNSDQYVATLTEAIEDAASVSETSGSDSGYASDIPLKIDSYLAKSLVDEIKSARGNTGRALVSAFAKFKQAVESGRAPHLGAITFLIQWLGRMGYMGEMHFTYSVAQRVLRALHSNKVAQTDGWFEIENAMIIGLAHHGDVEGAHQHRHRIIANGGAPDADAYGALIYNVKDTTDDASNALELFHESQTYRVNPNGYLYNNIISKLAKARKADYAMELFQQMKAQGVQSTSVTFGAVIGACARVGDVQSAELLFSEMTQAKNFKPRIPPYNTMMQMYTMTKLDRARALYFYQEMLKVNISPTAHTYRLLLDAYGSIEPVDLEGMKSTWETLKADKTVSIQGTHYASLLNAYGCVSKDFDKAVEVFNSIDIARDSIVYEAMFNVLTVNRRTDLINEYINKMRLEGVHMTAYIANSLIKGYSLLDNIEEARKVFESLEDPPEGVAASNNHAPHSPHSEVSPAIDQSTSVYREPSTWEAMVRAELGSGNRDGALALLERLKARQVSF